MDNVFDKFNLFTVFRKVNFGVLASGEVKILSEVSEMKQGGGRSLFLC